MVGSLQSLLAATCFFMQLQAGTCTLYIFFGCTIENWRESKRPRLPLPKTPFMVMYSPQYMGRLNATHHEQSNKPRLPLPKTQLENLMKKDCIELEKWKIAVAGKKKDASKRL